ncbi:unnamed protein product [Lampetra fluviatilis]
MRDASTRRRGDIGTPPLGVSPPPSKGPRTPCQGVEEGWRVEEEEEEEERGGRTGEGAAPAVRATSDDHEESASAPRNEQRAPNPQPPNSLPSTPKEFGGRGRTHPAGDASRS